MRQQIRCKNCKQSDNDREFVGRVCIDAMYTFCYLKDDVVNKNALCQHFELDKSKITNKITK